MMKLLLPLGLLGLLGVLALIIIYIIKPNYQTKHVSSTFVWQLSLKKRRRIPISKIRNLLVFLCQILILTGIGLTLAQPVIYHENESDKTDIIVILDSSASMRARDEDGKTRFERAIAAAKSRCDSVTGAGGYATLIFADESPRVLASRISLRDRSILNAEFEKLQDAAEEEDYYQGDVYDEQTLAYMCSYGTSNIDAAIELAKDVLSVNPNATISLYTDTTYAAPGSVEIVNVAKTGEWNAAILDAEATIVEGYCELTVDVACYGRDELFLDLEITVENPNTYDANEIAPPITIHTQVACSRDEPKRLVFCRAEGTDSTVKYILLGAGKQFYSYSSIHIQVDAGEEDSYTSDDNFDLYGGHKEVIRVQYASLLPNAFVNTALDTLRRRLADRWDIQITEVQLGKSPAMDGFDLYIFEHYELNAFPTDGAVIVLDPVDLPASSGLRVLGSATSTNGDIYLEGSISSPVTNAMKIGEITIQAFRQLQYNSDYEMLMEATQQHYPMLLVRNDGPDKVAVVSFSVHYSNIAILPEWMFLWANLMNYFFPSTVEGTSFEVNEAIPVNARGDKVVYSGQDEPLTKFPTSVIPRLPGTYTFELDTYYGQKTKTSVYVKTPAAESNLFNVEYELNDPYGNWEFADSYDDLLIWFAAALVAFLFLEYWLQGRQAK